MAISERIHFFRLMRGMTQKYLGTAIGFPEKSADVRLAQYETGTRKPKAEPSGFPEGSAFDSRKNSDLILHIQFPDGVGVGGGCLGRLGGLGRLVVGTVPPGQEFGCQDPTFCDCF